MSRLNLQVAFWIRMSTECAIAREIHVVIPWWRCRRYRIACRRAFASHFSRMLLLERAACFSWGDFSRSARAHHPSPFYALSLFRTPCAKRRCPRLVTVYRIIRLFSLIHRTTFSFIVHRSPDDTDTHTRNTWRALLSLARASLFSPFPSPFPSPHPSTLSTRQGAPKTRTPGFSFRTGNTSWLTKEWERERGWEEEGEAKRERERERVLVLHGWFVFLISFVHSVPSAEETRKTWKDAIRPDEMRDTVIIVSSRFGWREGNSAWRAAEGF